MKSQLRALRTAKGWSQEEMGKRLGVSRQAVIAIETDKHDPSLDLAFRIAALFGMRVEELFENPHA